MISDSNSVVATNPAMASLGEPPQCLQGQDEQQQHQQGGDHVLQGLQRAAAGGSGPVCAGQAPGSSRRPLLVRGSPRRRGAGCPSSLADLLSRCLCTAMDCGARHPENRWTGIESPRRRGRSSTRAAPSANARDVPTADDTVLAAVESSPLGMAPDLPPTNRHARSECHDSLSRPALGSGVRSRDPGCPRPHPPIPARISAFRRDRRGASLRPSRRSGIPRCKWGESSGRGSRPARSPSARCRGENTSE